MTSAFKIDDNASFVNEDIVLTSMSGVRIIDAFSKSIIETSFCTVVIRSSVTFETTGTLDVPARNNVIRPDCAPRLGSKSKCSRRSSIHLFARIINAQQSRCF